MKLKIKIMGVLSVTLLLILFTMIDRVHEVGGHTKWLVLAPYPTLFEFDHSAGESIEAWQRRNPDKEFPWWLKGDYIVLVESTDG